MGALPKNKITSVERGKRRAGNRPQLKKDKNATIPLHKQGLVAQILKSAGILKAGKDDDKATKRAATKADRRANRAVVSDSKTAQKAASTSVKKTTRTTQHKG